MLSLSDIIHFKKKEGKGFWSVHVCMLFGGWGVNEANFGHMSSFILRQRRPLHIDPQDPHTEKILQDQEMEWPSPRFRACSWLDFILQCSCPSTQCFCCQRRLLRSWWRSSLSQLEPPPFLLGFTPSSVLAPTKIPKWPLLPPISHAGPVVVVDEDVPPGH